MKKSLCEELVQYLSRISEFEDLYSTFIVNLVSNSFLCYTAITLNIVTIRAIRKPTSSLPKTLKTLLVSLAISDVGVGLLAQPLYISLLVNWTQQSIPSCGTYKAFTIIGEMFTLASFFGVVAVSVDRFLAIHLHLRYQELVTHKRVVAVVISIWVLSTLFSSMRWWVPSNVSTILLSLSTVVGLILTTVAYIRIYLVVRRHKNQIQVLQVQQVAQTGEMANFAGLIKSAVCTFYVYVVYLICYLPIVIYSAALSKNNTNVDIKKILPFALTLLYLNSSLNPVIYYLKMRHIRHELMDILRNMSWSFRNHASQ